MDRRELELFEERTAEAQFLRDENRFLRRDRDEYRKQWIELAQYAGDLEERNQRLADENGRLRSQVEQLKQAAAAGAEAAPPDFVVKPSIDPHRRRRRPGRKPGHPAALRPVPAAVDAHRDVPLPRDAGGRDCCPSCACPLRDVRGHERLVEDLVPARVVVTCYHTRSGYCAACRRRVESRAPEQPPAANVPHGQLGLDALATAAAVLRVVHRLPLRHVARVPADLPGLSVSAGGVARQLQRLAGWLDPYYERVLLALRAAPRVHADETGWRTDGRNGFLWAVTGPRHTAYHVDHSRSGAVIERLIGGAFGGTLVADFFSAYNALPCPKQRCLAHLLREFAEAAERHPAFAASAFCREAVKVVKRMLALKRQWDRLGDATYTARVCRLESKLAALARGTYDEPNAGRIAKRMLKHERELTAFLWERDLDGTNNAAERALRPAVVARKISGGSRSDAGARAWAKLASLMRTASQQGRNVLDVVKQLLVEHWAGRPAMALTAGA